MNKAMDMTYSLPEFYAGMTLEQLTTLRDELERLEALYGKHIDEVGLPVAIATFRALLQVHVDAVNAEIDKRLAVQS